MKKFFFVAVIFMLLSCHSEESRYFEISDSKDLTADADGSTFAISVKSNVSWSANSNKDWITLNPVESEDNGIVSVTVSGNPTKQERNGTIVFSSAVNTVNINIKQLIKDYIDVSKSTLLFGWKNSSDTLDITSNAECSLDISDNWLHAEKLSSSSETQTITENWQIMVDENKQEDIRTANIRIKNGIASTVIIITQKGTGVSDADGEDAIIDPKWNI